MTGFNPLPPDPARLPEVDTLPPEAVTELAEAYVDLLRLMTEALYQCNTGTAFFRWNGRGFEITGHPPDDVVKAIREATT